MKSFRKPILVANWKMNKTSTEARLFAEDFASTFGQQRDVTTVLCPPFTALSAVSAAIEGSTIILGAQNMHPERSGAFTGEISADMLRDLFVSYVLVGHSERRRLFGETNAFIHSKITSALAHQLKPILCIGETLEEREASQTERILFQQLEEALHELNEKQVETLHIAYEPIWAIGTGHNATPEIAQDIQSKVRNWLKNRFGEGVSEKIRLLYGGSMNPENAASLFEQPDIDGGLIGGASLEVRSFAKLLEIASANA